MTEDNSDGKVIPIPIEQRKETLRQLRSYGLISEEKYREVLAAIRSPEQGHPTPCGFDDCAECAKKK